ncbi:MAG TPA: PilZ domain-containing protein [Vicinamibacterales bacterium]|nr:PilZ domain-containing protein [Vicinamibacterales bacterium]
MADTVLIAAPEHLQALKEHGGFGDAQAFSDADALKALEVITRDKPAVVVLEQLFAATSRGAALIKRVKADPSLTGCEIKVVSHDGKPATGRKKKNGAAPAAQAAGAVVAPPAPAPAVAAPVAPLDQRGTRRAPRFTVVGGIEVMIDGKPAMLVNLSVVGAQVISPTILKPNQRVRMILPTSDRPIRFVAGVAWAAFEMPKAGPQYRAGIEFYDAEADNVDKFIVANKAT